MGLINLTDALPEDQALINGWTTGIINSLKGAANGLAPLGADSKIDVAYLPTAALSTQWGAITGTLTDQTDLNNALASKANTASPAFSGVPTAPTAPLTDSSIQIATTEFVRKYLQGRSHDAIRAIYENKSFNIATESTFCREISWSPDGANMIVLDSTNDNLHQYVTSVGGEPFQVAELSFWQSKSILAQSGVGYAMFIKPDGTKVYIADAGTDLIYQYSMTTPWDISTLVYDNKTLSIAPTTTVSGMDFSPDGMNVYISCSGLDAVYQYTLTTAWDVSTGSYSSKTFSLLPEVPSSTGMRFTPDGYSILIIYGGLQTVFQWDLTTPWDISTASYNGIYRKFQDLSQPTSIFFGRGGLAMFIADNGTDLVYQFISG